MLCFLRDLILNSDMVKTLRLTCSTVVKCGAIHSFRSLSYSSRTLGFALICLLSICPNIYRPCKEVARLKAT